MGFILPHKFFNTQYGEPLRGLISKEKQLAEVIHFGENQVFPGATTYTCLMFLEKGGSDKCRFEKVRDLAIWKISRETNIRSEIESDVPVATEGIIPASRISQSEWNFVVGKGYSLFEKLRTFHVKLGEVAHLFVGLQTDADDVFILDEIKKYKNRVLCKSKATGRQHWFEDEHLKSFLKGSINIGRYHLKDVKKRLIFPYVLKGNKTVLIDTNEYKQRYPLTWNYLEENHKRLVARNKGKLGREWYGYVYKKNHSLFRSPKLLVPSIATGSCFAIDLDGKYYFVGSGGGGGGGYGITLKETTNLTYPYLLGLLNSKLLSSYLKNISTYFRGGYIALNRQYIGQLPIRTIDFNDSYDKNHLEKIEHLVNQTLLFYEQLQTKTGHEKIALQRQIDAAEQQIDQLVYELYGLTEEEISIVEGSSV